MLTQKLSDSFQLLMTMTIIHLCQANILAVVALRPCLFMSKASDGTTLMNLLLVINSHDLSNTANMKV